MASLIVDQGERERRSKNDIIFGIKKSNKAKVEEQKVDDAVIRKIFTTVSSFGFKSREVQSQDPPIILRLKSKAEREELIRSARKLRHSTEFSTTYINPDLNDLERKID